MKYGPHAGIGAALIDPHRRLGGGVILALGRVQTAVEGGIAQNLGRLGAGHFQRRGAAEAIARDDRRGQPLGGRGLQPGGHQGAHGGHAAERLDGGLHTGDGVQVGEALGERRERLQRRRGTLHVRVIDHDIPERLRRV